MGRPPTSDGYRVGPSLVFGVAGGLGIRIREIEGMCEAIQPPGQSKWQVSGIWDVREKIK